MENGTTLRGIDRTETWSKKSTNLEFGIIQLEIDYHVDYGTDSTRHITTDNVKYMVGVWARLGYVGTPLVASSQS